MAKTILELAGERVVVFDGAMGTMLLASGLPIGGTPELWNLEQPDIVEAIHRKYYDAGSDVVHTNTFGGTALKLADKGHADKAEQVNLAAVKIAKKACPENGFVAGDIGPTGRMLPLKTRSLFNRMLPPPSLSWHAASTKSRPRTRGLARSEVPYAGRYRQAGCAGLALDPRRAFFALPFYHKGMRRARAAARRRGDPAGRLYGPPLPVQARQNPQILPIRVLHSTGMQNPNLAATER